MQPIKVNGTIINPDKIACIQRRSGERWIGGRREIYEGVGITFDAGGYKWFEGVEADMIEAAYNDYFIDKPLPY